MILVEYACPECRRRQERWAEGDIPATTACAACGASARRRFGGTLLGAGPPAPTAPEPARPSVHGHSENDAHGHSHSHSHGTPGDCVLTPTAARMLRARIGGDRRLIEREAAHQEKEIGAGRLDPHRAPLVEPPQ